MTATDSWPDRWVGYLRDVVVVAVAVFILVSQVFADEANQLLVGAAVTLLITPVVIRGRKKID